MMRGAWKLGVRGADLHRRSIWLCLGSMARWSRSSLSVSTSGPFVVRSQYYDSRFARCIGLRGLVRL